MSSRRHFFKALSTGGVGLFIRGNPGADRLLANPDFDPGFDQLIDMTAATKLEISEYEARTIATRRISSLKSRRAIVATEPHIFGLGTKTLFNSHTCRVRRNRQAPLKRLYRKRRILRHARPFCAGRFR